MSALHCWEDGTDYGHPNTTCFLNDGHDEDHEWTPDSDIIIDFR